MADTNSNYRARAKRLIEVGDRMEKAGMPTSAILNVINDLIRQDDEPDLVELALMDALLARLLERTKP